MFFLSAIKNAWEGLNLEFREEAWYSSLGMRRVSQLDFPSASHVNLYVDVANVRDMVRCKQRINPLQAGVKSRRPRQTTGPNVSTFFKKFYCHIWIQYE